MNSKENSEKKSENKALGASPKIARILLDVVSFDEKSFELSEPNLEEVQEIFRELEFRRLEDRFRKLFTKEEQTQSPTSEPKKSARPAFDLFNQPGAGELSVDDTYKSLSTSKHLYQSIQTATEQEMLLEWLLQQKSVCFDTETTGLDELSAELVGIAFSWEKGTGYYLPFPEDRTACETKLAYFAPFFKVHPLKK